MQHAGTSGTPGHGIDGLPGANAARLPFNIQWSDEDAAYIATCPEFPGLSAFADAPEKALEQAREVLDEFLHIYKEEGKPLPVPHTIKEYSGQFRVRLPKSLHRLLAEQAEREGVSLNALAVSYLSRCAGTENAGRMMHSGPEIC